MRRRKGKKAGKSRCKKAKGDAERFLRQQEKKREEEIRNPIHPTHDDEREREKIEIR